MRLLLISSKMSHFKYLVCSFCILVDAKALFYFKFNFFKSIFLFKSTVFYTLHFSSKTSICISIFLYSDCITTIKLDAVTGEMNGAHQSPSYGANPLLVFNISGTRYSAEIGGDKNYATLVTREILVGSFNPSLPSCINRSDIESVYLQAPYDGTDGWFVVSVSTYTKTASEGYTLLTSDKDLQKWIDYDEKDSYTYDATLVPLTIGGSHDDDCLTELEVKAKTGDIANAEFRSRFGRTHHIQLVLKNGTRLQGNLKSARKGLKYECTLSFKTGLDAGTMCVKIFDIQMVWLIAGTNDGWYITSISTYVKTATSGYRVLTEDKHFEQWLDGNEHYPYDAKKHLLSLGVEDTPPCGYERPACVCNPSAVTCIFNLEVDEILTFTSYLKLPLENGGLFIRGTQGVSYFIQDDGTPRSHKSYKSRPCSSDAFNSTNCTQPQYVDGKTFRTAIGVNGLIPGPTLIVHDQQMVVIHVHNNLSTDGISIHWHGMHQRETPWMDGVGQISHCQIGPDSTFTYMYKASPSGTFWYHSHTGTQRTDGFFGGLVVMERPASLQKVKERLAEKGVGDFQDHPDRHVILLQDWEHEPAFDRLNAGLGFFPDAGTGEVPDDSNERYSSTRSIEYGEVGPVPFFSGLINGKGRHSSVPYNKTRLSVFNVTQGERYRFRLVGAQGLYAYKFSIDGHKLTVVGTDGYWTEPVRKVDFIIIHTGERYDFILEADQRVQNYWMRAETLEINKTSEGPPYQSLGHVAEAILQYLPCGQTEAPDIPSYEYEAIKSASPPIICDSCMKCRAVNCPFKFFQTKYYTECINIDEMRLLLPTPSNELPQPKPDSNCPDCLHFINFNFEGDSETSAVNGRNFVLPSAPPQTQFDDFVEQATRCNNSIDCNPSTTSCLCTYVIDLPHQKTVQLVFSAIGAYDNAHPIHVHGHTFHVVKVGYPEYDLDTGFIKRVNGTSIYNPDIKCADTDCTNPGCVPARCTRPSWANPPPSLSINEYTIRKDTVIVPAAGYVVINFITDNPGFWFLHCHIEVHQLEGMALVLNEAWAQQNETLAPPASMNQCGDFALTLGEFDQEEKEYNAMNNPQQSASKVNKMKGHQARYRSNEGMHRHE